MSSDEDLYLIEAILNQRRRKRGLEYLVRWKGYSEHYDSWEPAAGVAHCSLLIKQFMDKRKSRSKSPGRRGGHYSFRSTSRSRSPGRQSKPRGRRSRSRSHSATRTPTQSTAALAIPQEDGVSSTTTSQEWPSVRSRRAQESEERASEDVADITAQKASTALKAEVVGRAVETVQSTPAETELDGTTSLANVVLGRAHNHYKPTTKGPGSSMGREKRGMGVWRHADYVALALFFIISLCFLLYTIGSYVELIPGALRQTLVDSYRWVEGGLSLAVHKLTSAASAVYSQDMEDLGQLWQWMSASGPEVEHNHTVKQSLGA